MPGELIPSLQEAMITRGAAKPAVQDRSLVRRAKKAYDDVRLTALRIDGELALGAHVMQGITDLDRHRQSLVGDNPALNSILLGVERETIKAVGDIQNAEYKDPWL